MKKLLASLAAAFLLTQIAPASVTINLGLGTMYSGTTTGSSTFANGGLITILAVTNGTWATLPSLLGYSSLADVFANTTSEFAPTNTVLVGKIGNNDGSGPGVTANTFIYNYSGGFQQGVELLAVGYSTLTTNSVSPGQSTLGFFFRTASVIDGSDIAWIAPADGGLFTLAAYTSDLGGSVPDNTFTSGNGAQGGNGFTTVPEPSTYALLALSAMGMGGYMIRRRRR